MKSSKDPHRHRAPMFHTTPFHPACREHHPAQPDEGCDGLQNKLQSQEPFRLPAQFQERYDRKHPGVGPQPGSIMKHPWCQLRKSMLKCPSPTMIDWLQSKTMPRMGWSRVSAKCHLNLKFRNYHRRTSGDLWMERPFRELRSPQAHTNW